MMAAKLQRKNEASVTLGVLGNGIMAHLVIDMYDELVKIEQAVKFLNIVIWARNKENAVAFCKQLTAKYPGRFYNKHMNL